MTIADTSRRAGPYTITLGASYPFSFVVFNTDEVTVTISDADGNETELDPSLFTVTLTETGGSVDIDSSVTGEKIVITSAVPMTQEQIITNKGGFYPDVLNKAHDKLTALVQQLDEKIDRAIKVPVSSSSTADEYKAEIEAIANEAKASAEQAVSSAASAEARVTSVESLASQASEDASSAVEQAQQAATTAGNAVASASSAVTTAGSAVTTAGNATALANDAVTAAMQAKTQAQTASSNASTAITRADAASAFAQSSYQAVQTIQANLPSDIEEEVSRKIGAELEGTVETIVRQVAPQIIEETAASKDYVDTAVSGEATARASADTALGQRIDNIGNNLATVATTGSYNDLTNKPTIPTVPSNVSAFTNDANYTSKTYVDEAIENIDALPDQTGQANKVLGTDGTSASWVSPPSGRNLHEWVWSSLPLTDAGLHLADGAFIPFGGVYDKWARDVERIKNAGLCPDSFVTQAEFDASVSAYGSCGKFVVSASGVRLPKVSDILQGTTDLSAVGDLVEAGLPNITGSIWSYAWKDNHATGAFYEELYSADSAMNGGSNVAHRRSVLDASRASQYYKDSVTKPTPQTIKSLLYICVATSVKTPVEVNIDNVITDVNNKLDRDLSNVVGDAVERVVEQGDNYIRYSSGKQICWGDCTATGTVGANSSISKNTSFPVSFVDSTYNISFGCRIDGGATNHLRQKAYGRYTSYFSCSWFNSGGVSCGSTTYTYTAIGRWK